MSILKRLIAHLQTTPGSHNIWDHSDDYSHIMSYDLSFGENGQWKSNQKMPISSHMYLSKYTYQNNFENSSQKHFREFYGN